MAKSWRFASQEPKICSILLFPSSCFISCFSTSMRYFLKAFSIRSLASGSFSIVLDADAVPVKKPSSPPRNKPPTEKKK